MRKSLLLLTTALTLAMAGQSNATPTGWYVDLAGGANWMEDTGISNVAGANYPYGNNPNRPEDIEPDTGWVVTGAIGYSWKSNWRLEFELGYRSNDGDIVRAYVTPSPHDRGDVEITQFTQMLNVYYDIPVTDRWTLSLGAGIGGDLVSYEDSALSGGNDTNPPNGLNYDDDYVLAGQLKAQVAYQATNRLQIYADYTYLMADDPEFSSTTGNYAISIDDNKHAVKIGLRYDLAPDEEPVVYVAPPPPPPPASAPRQFIVFFGFNKANLTSDAQRVVGEAASAAKSSGAASILITGHTDTVGSSRYNDRLSMRRANTVKDELVRQGIGAGMISATGRGETELLVQTGDNTKEPQNRRATIDLN